MKCSATLTVNWPIMQLIFKCPLTARLLLQLFAYEIVQHSFNNVSQTERSTIKNYIVLFQCKL